MEKVEYMQRSRRGKSGIHARKSLCKKKERNLQKSCRSRKKKETCQKVVAQEKRKKRKKLNIKKILENWAISPLIIS